MDSRPLAVKEQQEGAERFMRKAHFKSILDLVPAVVSIKDSRGRYVLANNPCEKLLGRGREAILGKTDGELWPAPIAELLRADDERALGDGAMIECEETLPQPDGPHAFLSVKFPLHGGSEMLVCSVMIDITERKRIERLKDDAIAMAGHELRTPLTVIQGALRVVLAAGPEEAAGGVPLLEMALRNSQLMLNVIDSYLDLAKIENGEVPLRSDEIGLTDLAAEAADAMKVSDAGRGLNIRFAGGQKALFARGDADRVREVFDNLLSNAVKYSPPGGAIEMSVAAYGDYVRVSIRDQGPGIRKTFAPLVFRRFSRDVAASGGVKGAGLGLSIAKSLVERMGGSIWFETQEGSGTTFSFTLPAARRREAGRS
ncbi:MAG: ATP-binding protein [Elusimicrobiota bacterium]